MKCAVRLPGFLVLAAAVASMLAVGWMTPASATTYFGLVNTGELYASTDAGVTWTIRGVLPVRDAVALVAGTSSTQLMMASESGGFYRSTDAGANWAAVGVVTASDVTALVSYPGRVLLFTRSGSVYSSLDSGATFTGIGVITASDVMSATKLDSNVYAVTGSGSVYRSADTGATWTAVGVITASNVVEIAPLGTSLYALTATGDIARSPDSGVTWTFVSTLSQTGMTALVLATNVLVATTGAGEVATSTNGTSWTWRGAMNQLTVRALATDIPTGTFVPAVPSVAVGFLGPRPNPGPLSSAGTIDLVFNLTEAATVTLRVLDVRGREVASPLRSEVLSAGETARAWRPGAIPSGTYFLHATIGDRVETRKLIFPGIP